VKRAIIFLLLAASVFAITDNYEILVPEPTITGMPATVDIGDYGKTHETGQPMLPVKTFYYEVPMVAQDIKVTVKEKQQRQFEIGEIEKAQPIMPSNSDELRSDPAKTYAIYPEESLIGSEPKIMNKRKLLPVTVMPLQVSGETATFTSKYKIQVSYKIPASQHYSWKTESQDGPGEVLASEIIENYGSPILTTEPAAQAPAGVDIKYAIITSATFDRTLEPLAEWKTQKGVPAKVYYVADIYANYSGYDNAEKIRNFLVDLESTYDLDYVLLAGDVADVPTRNTWIDDGEDTSVPSDYYFADLQGGYSPYDWDLDGDNIYGEVEDNIDWMPEAYVGRLSAANDAQMQAMVAKIINYEKGASSGSWQNDAILAGGNADTSTDDALLMEYIRTDFLEGKNTYDRIYYFANYTRDYVLNSANFQSRVTNGASMITWSGHGSYYTAVPDLGQPSFVSTSTNPSNGNMYPMIYADSCSTGAYDVSTCLGEDTIRDWAIGFIGASRVSWYAVGWDSPSVPYNQAHAYRYNEQLVGNNKYQAGRAFWDSKVEYISDFDPFSYDISLGIHYASRKNLLNYNLLGDPELNVWMHDKGALGMSVQENFVPGSLNTIVATILENGSTPLPGAAVTITNGNDIYESTITSGSGQASFNITTSNEEDLVITAVYQDMAPAQENISASGISITPIAPSGQRYINPYEINFTYAVNGPYNVSYCELIIGSHVAETDNTVTVNTTEQITWDNPQGGNLSWRINCTTTTGFEASSSKRYISVIEMENFDGNSTDITSVDVENISNLIIEQSTYGIINFTEAVNLSAGANLDSHVRFDQNVIEVDSDAIPALNKPAILTMKGVSFSDPVILRDRGVCDDCTVLEVGGNYVKFQVQHFSMYQVTGSAIDILDSGRISESDTGNATSEGGNLTNVNLTTFVSTDRWQGFYGNVSGSLAFGYNSHIFYNFAGGTEKAVYATQNISMDFFALQAGAANDVDTAWNYADGNDQAEDIFTGQQTNITGIIAPSIELNPAGQNLNSTILYDGNTGKEAFAFGAVISNDATCFDGKVCDFELIVPSDGKETYYLFLEVS